MKNLGKVFVSMGGMFLLVTLVLVAKDSFGWSLETPIVESFDAQLFFGLTGVALIQMGRAAMKAKNDWLLVQQSRKQRRKEGTDG